MNSNYSIVEHVVVRQSGPSVPEVIEEITTFLIVAHTLGLILFLITTVKFLIYIPSIFRNTPKRFLTRTLLLCGFYSIISASSYTSMMVPRAFVFCDGVMLLVYSLTTYQFFCMCLDYAGGETKFIEKANGENVFTMRTFPFCCCCIFLKPMKITKRKLTILRLVILQMPIALALIYFVVLVIQMEDSILYNTLSTYILPFIGVAILPATWGSEMVIHLFLSVLPGFNLKQKHISVVLVLLFCKMQPLMAQIEFAVNGEQWHQYPITKGIFSNTIIQLLVLIQMLLLSIWSHQAYKTPSNKTEKRDSETV